MRWWLSQPSAPGEPALEHGFLSRLPGCRRDCEPDSGARSRLGGRQAASELEEQRGGWWETRAPGAGAGDSAALPARWAWVPSPRAAPAARPREVTSGVPPEAGPAQRGGRAGVCGKATPSGRGPAAKAGPVGAGLPALPLSSAGSFIFMRRGAGPGSPTPTPRRPVPPLCCGSRLGGGSGPSGAPPASASGRGVSTCHNSKMCRSRSSAPSSLPRCLLLGRQRGGVEASSPSRGRSVGMAGPSSLSKLAPVRILL